MTQEKLNEIFSVQEKDIMGRFQSSFYQFDIIEEDGYSHNSVPRLHEKFFEELEFSHYWAGLKHFPVFRKIKGNE